MKVIFVLFTALLIIIVYSKTAIAEDKEEVKQKKIDPCQMNPRHQQFDFWLGQFDVYGDFQKNTPMAGTNNITKHQKGCLILENWTGSKGSTGTSMNYYDGTIDKWVQHWVSADGTTINIEGNIVDGSMVLVGKIYYVNAKENQIRDFKGTWTALENGVVRQFFEESIDSGKSWVAWFEGFYFPQTL